MNNNLTRRIFVAGHKGMVGSSIVRALKSQCDIELITVSRDELDLTNQSQVNAWFYENKPDEVYLAAAKVGGIQANNNYPAEFIYQNLLIQSNVIHSSYINKVDRLLFLGSSCIYPKFANQPITESELLGGKLEETNEPYAIAKIAGIKLCESYRRQYGCDFRSLMPTNLYGPGDNFDLQNAHVIPALLRRLHVAKENNDSEVVIWGTGTPMREFLHVDDLANASVHILNIDRNLYESITNPMMSHINVGTSVDFKISELAEIISDVVGFKGDLIFDTTKPDGTPRKLMDSSKIRSTGWVPTIELKEGLKNTYSWYKNNLHKIRSF